MHLCRTVQRIASSWHSCSSVFVFLLFISIFSLGLTPRWTHSASAGVCQQTGNQYKQWVRPETEAPPMPVAPHGTPRAH